jgi:hypothetical protein
MATLERLLASRLPPGWSARAADRGRRLVLRGPDGSSGEVAVVSKARLAPREAAELAPGLRDSGPALIAVPFLSPRTREVLARAGLSFLDETGNARIAIGRPALFIETAGAERDPDAAPSRPIRSLKGRAAGRVVRALCDFTPPYGVRALAERSATALGSVARVAAFLDGEALLKRDGAGRVVSVAWEDLLRRWAQDYDVMRSNTTSAWLAPRGLDALCERLRKVRGPWCFTASMAGSRRAAVAPPRLAVLYAGEAEALAGRLDLRRAETGANVVLARPYDVVVFDRTWEEDGLRFAALSQVAADLLTSPGRGPAEADELLRWMAKHESRWRT